MAVQSDKNVNRLNRLLPEGLVVDAAWMTRHGYSTSLRNQYVKSGWLKQPVARVYKRPRGPLNWQQTVISLQTMLGHKLIVGGRSALEVQGLAHYLTRRRKEIHLYGPKRPPSWLEKVPAGVRFVYHNSERLFRHCTDRVRAGRKTALPPDLVAEAWGQWDWSYTLSSPERAILELLDELPDRESFHQVDKIFEGLANLSPRRLQPLLEECRNVKVKRLFFYFAERHRHAWLRRIDRSAIDLGKGKRMLVRGGTYNAKWQITVPKDLDADS